MTAYRQAMQRIMRKSLYPQESPMPKKKNPRNAGRKPSTPLGTRTVSFSLSVEAHAKLDQIAKKRGLSRSAALSAIVMESGE